MIGDRVRVARAVADSWDYIGLTGTIMYTDTVCLCGSRSGIGYAIEFDVPRDSLLLDNNSRRPHDCGGNIPSHNGWWFYPEALDIINKRRPE